MPIQHLRQRHMNRERGDARIDGDGAMRLASPKDQQPFRWSPKACRNDGSKDIENLRFQKPILANFTLANNPHEDHIVVTPVVTVGEKAAQTLVVTRLERVKGIEPSPNTPTAIRANG